MQKVKNNELQTDINERKRSSGLFSFLKLFSNKSADKELFDGNQSLSASRNSFDSGNTIISNGTIASFVFVNPSTYRFFRKKSTNTRTIQNVAVCDTETYRKRIEHLEIQRQNDKNLTLRRKYKLPFIDHSSKIDRKFSLPIDKKTNNNHLRRSISDCCDKVSKNITITRKRVKRIAPDPPKMAKDADVIRRKKRTAPQPPNFELKVENDEPPKAVKEDTQVPKPWYKRHILINRDYKKKISKCSEILPIIGFARPKNESLKSELKRKSGLTFLSNISDLDKEADEILKKDRIRHEIPEFMKPKYLQQSQINGVASEKQNQCTKDLIAKFNAIGDTTNVTTSSSATQGDKVEIVDKCKETTFSDTKKEKNWKCPRCALSNDYWRILCYVCNCIKPLNKKIYPKLDNGDEIARNDTAITQTADDLAIYSAFNNCSTLKMDDTLFSDCNTKLKKSASSSKVVQLVCEPSTSTGSGTGNQAVSKKEEQIILKKMLIEMKNSLPKKPKKKFEVIVGTKEFSHESIQVRKNQKKPIKVSSTTQTNSISIVKPKSIYNDDNPYELIDSKTFEKMDRDRSTILHLYSNLKNEQPPLNLSTLMKMTRNLPDDILLPMGTVEVNKLLRKLESAISDGKMNQAAQFAKDLAHLQIKCSVVRQKIAPVTNLFAISFYVEDEHEQKGPFEIDIELNWPVSRLKDAVQNKYQLPTEVQRWIICNKLVSDDTLPLKKVGIVDEMEPIFVYLVRPAAVLTCAKFVPDNDDVLTTAEWECPVCTLINNEEMKNCVACFSLNPKNNEGEEAVVQDRALKSAEWQCSLCTLINDDEMKNCVTCFNSNPNNKDYDDHEREETVDPLYFWICNKCTSTNSTEMKNCVTCFSINPVYDDDQNNGQNYLDLVKLEDEGLVLNRLPFQCAICISEIEPQKGAILRDCLHKFCTDCLSQLIKTCTDPAVKCPYQDNDYACNSVLQDREIKSLVSAEEFDSFLKKTLNIAEAVVPNSFHCKTPDCVGWCIFEDNVNTFHCPICNKINCLTCQAIHTGYDCKQYQENLIEEASTDPDAKKSCETLQKLLMDNAAMRCPNCKVIIVKQDGCDAITCTMCKTALCWVTRGPRWGPKGIGDISGGCRCGVGGKKCHTMCGNCH